MNVTCWEWAGTARDEGDFAADWLSEVLGKPVRLVRYMGEHPGRQCHLPWLSEVLSKPARLELYMVEPPLSSALASVQLSG